MALPAGNCRAFVLPVQFVRLSSHNAPAAAADSNPNLQPEEMDNPGLFKKLAMRFKGIPLKGETHAPRSLFEDVDKEFFAPKSLPEVDPNYKEFPERDLKNYPYPARRMYPPKTRLLMIPDSWMTPFYKVTGVSGPYLFFGGLGAFMINKEIFVVEEHANKVLGLIVLYLFLTKVVGYRLDKALYRRYQEKIDHYKELIDEDLKDAKQFRKEAAAETASLETAKENFPPLLKESMGLQLEAAYRQNIQKVTEEMKRRVDYLQETEATKQRFERNHMLKWISNAVKAEIEANKAGVKEEYLANCIEQLKGLSVKI